MLSFAHLLLLCIVLNFQFFSAEVQADIVSIETFQNQTLNWTHCFAEMECATLNVPADYDHPRDEIWSLAIARYPWKSDGVRLGMLFVNPGGPGIPGIPDLAGYPRFWDTLRKNYDIITFDPRGTGSSFPTVDCLSDDEKYAIRNQVSSPESEAQIKLARILGRLQADSCFKKYGKNLALFSTKNVARDIDILRSAMGEPQISYLGFSYGTYLGINYAELFPGRTHRIVLDSVMNPAINYQRIRHDQAIGFQKSIERFISDCPRHEDCPLPPGKVSGLQALGNLVARMDKSPYKSEDGRELSGSRTLGLIESSMYMPEEGWPLLRNILKSAFAGNYKPMLEKAFSPALMVNPADSPYLAVMCHDLQTTRDPEAPKTLAKQWRHQAPLTGAARAWSLQPCEYWPVKSQQRPHLVSLMGAGPIMIVAGQNDPATPLKWARALGRQVKNAVSLEWRGEGHIVYGRGGSCADLAIESFLTSSAPLTQSIKCP